ncbi:hypothetical protein H0H92_001088 [Tricholoma furcatifolium]|nr:hypothetical protein H0H92_001088 [Tricholoma furcatifolium]
MTSAAALVILTEHLDNLTQRVKTELAAVMEDFRREIAFIKSMMGINPFNDEHVAPTVTELPAEWTSNTPAGLQASSVTEPESDILNEEEWLAMVAAQHKS